MKIEVSMLHLGGDPGYAAEKSVRECLREPERGRQPVVQVPGMDTAVKNWSGRPWRPAEGQGRAQSCPTPGARDLACFTLTLFSHWLGLLPGTMLCQAAQG